MVHFLRLPPSGAALRLRSLCTSIEVFPLCAAAQSLSATQQAHALAITHGLLPSGVPIAAALILSYAAHHSHPSIPHSIFHHTLPHARSPFLPNTFLRACGFLSHHKSAVRFGISSYNDLLRDPRFCPNEYTFPFTLKLCADPSTLSKGLEVHGRLIKAGFDGNMFVNNTLMLFYGSIGDLVGVGKVFDEMTVRDIFSWNTMIGSFAQNGRELEAVHLVRVMQAHGETPDCFTLTNVLPACARLNFLRIGREIHAKSMKSVSNLDLFISNALMDMYARCGRLDLAQTIFVASPKNEVSYNILITSYSQMEDCSNSITLFTEMEALGLIHDAISYMGVISACTSMHAVKEGKQVHALALRRTFNEDLLVANSLLDFYAKCGQINTAMRIFTQIRNKNSTSWNTMILAFGMLGEFNSAMDLFDAMKSDGVEHDSFSYLAMLSACSHSGLVEKGKEYFNHFLQAQHIQPLEIHYACMVDLLGRSGLMEEAMELISRIPGEPGGSVWGALLGASRVHGNIEVGCWAAEKLIELKAGDPGHYAVLANMYGDAGRWNEADRMRKLMKQWGVKKNPGRSWVMDSWVQVHDQVHSLVAGRNF